MHIDLTFNLFTIPCRKMCCETIRSIFINEGKHRGEATIETVRLIADHVKFNDCQLHPDSIEVFGDYCLLIFHILLMFILFFLHVVSNRTKMSMSQYHIIADYALGLFARSFCL